MISAETQSASCRDHGCPERLAGGVACARVAGLTGEAAKALLSCRTGQQSGFLVGLVHLTHLLGGERRRGARPGICLLQQLEILRTRKSTLEGGGPSQFAQTRRETFFTIFRYHAASPSLE